jgi:hypothetical protein
MYEKRSEFFKRLFDATGITYELKSDGDIDNNFVLKHNGTSLKTYYNEANENRGLYFALNNSYYSAFGQNYWLEAQNKRKETYLKLIPCLGEEPEAIEELILFSSSGTDA